MVHKSISCGYISWYDPESNTGILTPILFQDDPETISFNLNDFDTTMDVYRILVNVSAITHETENQEDAEYLDVLLWFVYRVTPSPSVCSVWQTIFDIPAPEKVILRRKFVDELCYSENKLRGWHFRLAKDLEISLRDARDLVYDKSETLADLDILKTLSEHINCEDSSDNRLISVTSSIVLPFPDEIPNEVDVSNMEECRVWQENCKKVEEICKRRKIKHLMHFTQEVNLESIIQHGLLGREDLAKAKIGCLATDEHRHDNVSNSICLSIEFINYLMLRSKISNGSSWVVLVLDSAILYEKKCLFFWYNAALKELASLRNQAFNDPLYLERMFFDDKNSIRRRLEIPDNFPTTPQAEVLATECIEARYILEYHVFKEGGYHSQPMRAGKCEFAARSIFAKRKDCDYWENNPKNRALDFINNDSSLTL